MERSFARILCQRRGRTAKTFRSGSSDSLRLSRVGDIQMRPCPFCGNRYPVAQEVDAERWAVCCEKCGTIGPHLTDDEQTLGEKATELWNKREV
jgi:hypothetical protein